MLEALLSLPTLLGCILFAATATIVGLAVWWLTFQIHTRVTDEGQAHDLRDATGNLLRVAGWLFSLLLSVTFADVTSELFVTEAAIEYEAAALIDIHLNLKRFEMDETREFHATLAEYTEAVIEDDWPALANDRLSERAMT